MGSVEADALRWERIQRSIDNLREQVDGVTLATQIISNDNNRKHAETNAMIVRIYEASQKHTELIEQLISSQQQYQQTVDTLTTEYQRFRRAAIVVGGTSVIIAIALGIIF